MSTLPRTDRRSGNPDRRSPFQLDVEVQLKTSVKHRCPQGRENNATARIAAFLPGIAEGAVKLDRDLRGCRYWNTEDLAPVAVTAKEGVR